MKLRAAIDKCDLLRLISSFSSGLDFCASSNTSFAVIKSPNKRVYPIITKGIASRYMSKVGNPIERGDVLLNRDTTSGILNPHSILKVTSFNRKDIKAARIKPGNNPSEPILLII